MRTMIDSRPKRRVRTTNLKWSPSLARYSFELTRSFSTARLASYSWSSDQ